MTLIITGMQVVDGTGERVQVEGGAGAQKKLKMFYEQILSRNEA